MNLRGKFLVLSILTFNITSMNCCKLHRILLYLYLLRYYLKGMEILYCY